MGNATMKPNLANCKGSRVNLGSRVSVILGNSNIRPSNFGFRVSVSGRQW